MSHLFHLRIYPTDFGQGAIPPADTRQTSFAKIGSLPADSQQIFRPKLLKDTRMLDRHVAKCRNIQVSSTAVSNDLISWYPYSDIPWLSGTIGGVGQTENS
jgi:hypothetical protein